jgi:uncharacterized protein (DUF885 family)
MSGRNVLSYDLFRRAAEQTVALQRFPAGSIPLEGFLVPYEWMSISQMSSVHIDIQELPRLAPLRTTKDYDDFVARLAAYPRQVDQGVELMKRGMAAGWVPPAVPIKKVLPREIHEVCKREVTRIRKAMNDVIQQTGFSGSLPELVKFLRADPRFAPVPTEEVLPGFRDIPTSHLHRPEEHSSLEKTEAAEHSASRSRPSIYHCFRR